jgi:hypothetical protein
LVNTITGGTSSAISGPSGSSVTTNATGTAVLGVINTNTATTTNTMSVSAGGGSGSFQASTGGTAVTGGLNTVGGNSGSTNIIGNPGTSINTVQGATNNITGTTSTTLNGAGNTVVVNSSGVNANGNGATLSMNATAVTLENSTGHGLQVYTDHTVLSGGTNSTQLDLNNTNATFSNTLTGAPIQVKGVADATDDHDAVNFSQLKDVYGGVASTVALGNIPTLDESKDVSIGVGVGYFKGTAGIAVGGNFRATPRMVFRVSLGTSTRGNATAGAGAAFSW